MFLYCLRLKMRSATGTKRKSHEGRVLMLSIKASKSTTKVTKKHPCIRYISATLLYLVRLPNKMYTILGKNDRCALCWLQRSDTCSVPENHLSKRGTTDHASLSTTLTPNVWT